jgi:carboxymethylenebutenolidase
MAAEDYTGPLPTQDPPTGPKYTGAYEEALKANHVTYTMHMYEGVNHGFHNDTTPRYDEAAAKLAWQRTLDFFNKYLR